MSRLLFPWSLQQFQDGFWKVSFIIQKPEASSALYIFQTDYDVVGAYMGHICWSMFFAQIRLWEAWYLCHFSWNFWHLVPQQQSKSGSRSFSTIFPRREPLLSHINVKGGRPPECIFDAQFFYTTWRKGLEIAKLPNKLFSKSHRHRYYHHQGNDRVFSLQFSSIYV